MPQGPQNGPKVTRSVEFEVERDLRELEVELVPEVDFEFERDLGELEVDLVLKVEFELGRELEFELRLKTQTPMRRSTRSPTPSKKTQEWHAN